MNTETKFWARLSTAPDTVRPLTASNLQDAIEAVADDITVNDVYIYDRPGGDVSSLAVWRPAGSPKWADCRPGDAPNHWRDFTRVKRSERWKLFLPPSFAERYNIPTFTVYSDGVVSFLKATKRWCSFSSHRITSVDIKSDGEWYESNDGGQGGLDVGVLFEAVRRYDFRSGGSSRMLRKITVEEIREHYLREMASYRELLLEELAVAKEDGDEEQAALWAQYLDECDALIATAG